MDTISAIILGANIVSIATGIIFLIKFFYNIYAKKGSFAENRNYLIAAFVFIVAEPLLIYYLGRVLAGYGKEIFLIV